MCVSLCREVIRMSRVALLCVFVVPSRSVGRCGMAVPPRGGICRRSRRMASLRGFLISSSCMGVSLCREVIRMSRVALLCRFEVSSRGMGCCGVPVFPCGGERFCSRRVALLRLF